MKHNIWAHHLMGAVFAFVLAVSTVGNMVTGFDLTVDSLMGLFLCCASFAFLSALLFRFRYGGTILLCLIGLSIPIVWKDGLLWKQLQSLSFTISSHYHSVYDWPILGSSITEEVTLPLVVLSAWSAVSVSWCFCRRKPIYTVIPSVILPLVLCLITTDKAPDTIYLYLLILGIALLLITDWTRRNKPAQSIKLTLRLALPVAAALALLFLMNPREKYVNNAGTYQKEIVSWFQQLQDTTTSISSGVSFESAVSEKLNLKYVGPKSKNSHSVMRVNSPIGGTIYLRGRDYDVYSGTGWEASLNRTETFSYGGVSSGEFTIVTYGVRDVLYVPYYSTKEIHLTGGALENDDNLQRYSFYLSRSASGDTDAADSRYTELPSGTRQWATPLVKDITSGLESQSEKIHQIENYVRNSATYDLATSRMDAQYDDFAQWFLEESDTGYCVHFATAATVLLRAAGIPARYVEGYMVTCSAGADVVVSSQEAHAWAEYFDSGSGAWHVLEATPADLQEEDETERPITTPSEESEPDTSETEPTAAETELPDSQEAPTVPHVSQEVDPSVPDTVPDSTTVHETKKEAFKLPDWIKTLFRILLAAACIPVQGYVRIARKRTLWNRGRSNEMALDRWKQTRQIARLLKIPYPEELDSLALKAKFSQHRIQPEELQQFENYRQSFIEVIRSKPWYQRILFSWIFAIG